jgi:inositol-phosphate phosphatase / L-galactose 1-phosphate phosphatase / histidinol-phosphatase
MIELIDTAHALADLARPIAQRYFRSHLAAEDKQDASPVTLADREIEAAIRQAIKQAHPSHGIIGEEQGNERADADWVWVIDPIDGTKSFMAGKPQFGTLIALLHHGKPVLGLVDQPILNERWLGSQGQVSSFNGAAIQVRPKALLADCIAFTTTPDMWQTEQLARLKSRVKRIVYGGDCYNYALLAMGHIDLVIEQDLKPYDYLALPPLIEGAGGAIVDWSGKALTAQSDGRVIACANPAHVPELLALLNHD